MKIHAQNFCGRDARSCAGYVKCVLRCMIQQCKNEPGKPKCFVLPANYRGCYTAKNLQKIKAQTVGARPKKTYAQTRAEGESKPITSEIQELQEVLVIEKNYMCLISETHFRIQSYNSKATSLKASLP